MSSGPTYSFNIGALYSQAFNEPLPEYNFGTDQNESDDYSSKFGSSSFRKDDALGRPYFMPAKLGDLDLGYPIIRVQGQKHIVQTQLTERKGSVIEIINQDSYKIYVRGFLIDHSGKFPEEQVFNLKELYEQNKSQPIVSALTDLFLTKDDRVVIADINFPEVTGIENIKPYELNLVSDSIFELEIQ